MQFVDVHTVQKVNYFNLFYYFTFSLDEDDIDSSVKIPLQNYGDSSKYDLSNTYQTVSTGGFNKHENLYQFKIVFDL